MKRLMTLLALAAATTFVIGCKSAPPPKPSGNNTVIGQGTVPTNPGTTPVNPGNTNPVTPPVNPVNANPCSGNSAPKDACVPVKVYFSQFSSASGNSEAQPLTRQVPKESAGIKAALEELLKGPTAGEQSTGFASFFSDKTAGAVKSVDLKDGKAIVDFKNFSASIPNAGTAAGSRQTLQELGKTIAQFPEVREIEYRFDGNCQTFWGWLQSECQPVAAARYR